MAFNKDNKLNNIITYLKKGNYDQKEKLALYIKKNRNNIKFDDDTLFDIIKIIVENDIAIDDFNSMFKDAKKLYNVVVNNKEDYEIFLKSFESYYSSKLEIEKYQKIYNLFQNKNIVEIICNEIENIIEKTDIIYQFIIKNRMYHISEEAFLSFFLSFINELKQLNNAEDIEELINKYEDKSKKIAGVYEIDDNKINEISNYIENLKEELNGVNIRQNDVLSYQEPTIEKLEQEINKIIEEKNQLIEIKNELEKQHQELLTDDILKEYAEVELGNINSKIRAYHSSFKSWKSINNEIIDRIVNYFKLNNTTKLEDSKQIELALYYFAKYNNTLDIYEKVITNCKLEHIEYWWFSYKYVDIFSFDKELYINLIINKSYLLEKYVSANKLDLLASLLKKDPSFSYDVTRASNYFTEEEILNGNKEFLTSISKITTDDRMQYYKKVYDINPNFRLHNEAILKETTTFSVEEVANFGVEFQELIKELCVKTNFRLSSIKYEYNIDENKLKYLLKDMALTELDEEQKKLVINRDLYSKNNVNLLSYTKLTFEQELLLSDEQYEELKNNYNALCNSPYVSKNNANISKSKLKKILKEINRK